MLLAGGEGKRLGLLTKKLAKPAVPFGGKYRIIDFALSNCANSGLQTLGVVTQYSPLELNKHIGNGASWGMNSQNSGVTVLSPYTAKDGGDWYAGTADAIYQNIHYIDSYDPEHVLVISGDHIYQMDYRPLLQHHIKTGADATISVMPVPWAQAPQFGILNTTEDMRIYEFDEKPKNPKSNLASMGIYIFNWKSLKAYLVNDAANKQSNHDFGMDIIPAMLANQLNLFAYRFEGYWKDVGTIQSYFDANMDLLDGNHLSEDPEFALDNINWRIYSNESNTPPQYISEVALIKDSLVNSGSWICGTVEKTVVFENVEIERGSIIYQSILHPGVKVGKDAVLERVIVMENTEIPEGFRIRVQEGEEPLVIDQEALTKILLEKV